MRLLGDSFWTMALGRTILATRALPPHDPFAYTSVHEPYFVHMPATAILFAWLASHAGLASVAAVAAAVNAGPWIVAWLGSSQRFATRLLMLPPLLLGEFLETDGLCARGQVFGSLGFALLLVLLDGVRRGRPVRWYVPFGLSVAWTNLHPSFMLAVVVPLAYAAMSYIDPPDERTPAPPLLAFAGWAAAGAQVTPYGPRLFVDVIKLMQDPTTARVDLFQPPSFRSTAWLAVAALALASMALRAHYGPRLCRGSDVAMLCALLAATCAARRYSDLLWLAVILTLGSEAEDALEKVGGMARLVAARFATLAVLAMTGGELLASAALAVWPKDLLFNVPAAAAAFVQSRDLPDHVFAPYHWGGYLDWAFDGRRKVFIDGRNMLFHNGVMQDALFIQAAGPGWSALLDAYDVETLITERWTPLDTAVTADPAWQWLFRDAISGVYVRRRTPRAPR